MVLTRMFVLERVFTYNELNSLDDELPDFGRVMRPRPRLQSRAVRNSFTCRRPALLKKNRDDNGENGDAPKVKKSITWAKTA